MAPTCVSIKAMYRYVLSIAAACTLISSQAGAICVSAEQANLRSGPSANSKLLWTVGKYMPLLALEQKGSWVQVQDFEGKKMWIFANLVSTDIDCAVVKVSVANLRKGPGAKFPQTPLSFAHKFMPFKKIGRDGAWLHIQDDYGYKHWVVENNIWEPLNYTKLSY